MLKNKPIIFSLFIAVTVIGFCVSNTFAQHLYVTPTQQMTNDARAKGPCSDPWVTIAIYDNTGGTRQIAGRGNYGECNTLLYNGGSWSSYQELAKSVYAAQHALAAAGVSFSISASGNQATITVLNGSAVADKTVLKLVGNSGGTLITNDGGTLVATGGGNFSVQDTASSKKINLGKSTFTIIKRH